MNKSRNVQRLFAVVIIGISLSLTAGNARGDNHEQHLKTGTFDDDFFAAGDKVIVDRTLKQDLYAAGGKIEVNAPVNGDVFAAGGKMKFLEPINGGLLAAGGKIDMLGAIGDDVVVVGGKITVGSTVSGDALLFGGKIFIAEHIAGNARAVGGKINLNSGVGGNALFGGGRIDLGENAMVAGKVTIAGGTVHINGDITKGLRVVAGQIIIDGHIAGDVNLRANTIIIKDTARIDGDLVYYSPQPIDLSDKIEFGGDVTFILSDAIHQGEDGMFAVAGAMHFFWITGLILAAIALVFIGPKMFPLIESRMKESRWKTVWVGLAALIIVPVIIVLLGGALFGLPLAIILVASYVITMMIGYFAAAYALGRKCLNWAKRNARSTSGGQIFSISLGLLLLGMAVVIPVIGVLMNILAVVIGLGAITLMLINKRHST